MFRRKVRIFGRSVPLAALLLAVTAVAAFAAFTLITSLTGTVSAQPQPGPFGHPAPNPDWLCEIISGSGTITTCANSGDGLDWAISGNDDDTVVRLTRTFENNGSFPADFVTNGDPAPEVQISVVAGGPLTVGQVKDLVFQVQFAGLAPGQNIGPFVWDLTWTNQ